MIIGISGKIGSGKDTVGLIVQHLLCKNTGGVSILDVIDDYKKHEWWLQEQSGFEVKKFADELKDTVCRWTSCTREELENRDFKEKELGEEWWYQEYIDKRSGRYVKIPYNDLPPTTVYNDETKGALIKLTPRLLLQLLGTDCGRNIIHPNIWVNSLMSGYRSGGFTEQGVLGYFPNWLITDTRFPNELKAIEDRRGVTIRVNRPRFEKVPCNSCQGGGCPTCNGMGYWTQLVQPKDEHESETAIDDADFKYTIQNDGTIEELVEKVRSILTLEKLL